MFLKNNNADPNNFPVSLVGKKQVNEKIIINNVKISLHGSAKFGKKILKPAPLVWKIAGTEYISDRERRLCICE